MIASAYGFSASYRYVFPVLQASDEVVVSRPAVIQQMGGADGAYDYYGLNRYPLAPVIYVKKFTLSGASYAAVETELLNAQAYTISDYRTIYDPLTPLYLYGTRRGGTAHAFYTPAKCLSFKAPETYGRNYTILPVEMQFQLPQPWWYGAAGTKEFTGDVDHPIVSAYITYSGNIIAPVVITVMPLTGSSRITYAAISNARTKQSVAYADATGTINGLELNTETYSALEGTSNPVYDKLTLGGNQTTWLDLVPGVNPITVSVHKSDGTWKVTLAWVERWTL